MPKRKCKFTEELQAKYPCFRVGREWWEAQCLVCQEGTYVSVANKGSLDLEAHVQSMKHQRNMLGDTSVVAKLPGCFNVPGATAETSLVVPAIELQDNLPKTPDPILDVLGLQIKMEARLDEVPLDHGVDLLDGVPYCGVALGAGEVGTPHILVRYFDWKQGGVQSRMVGVEPPLGDQATSATTTLVWDTLESHGLRQRCVALVGDSPNAMLGGCPQGPTEVSSLRDLLGRVFISTDCPAHLLNNCLQHGADSLEVDLQALVWKIYTYISVYSIHVEPLKDFLEFAKREHQRLLHYPRMSWLLLLPAITHLLQVFPTLKSFFLSLNHPPFTIRTFFQDDFSEIYLQHMASQVALFQVHLKNLAKEDNSPCEVLGVLSSLRHVLLERRAHGFVSQQVMELLEEQRVAGRVGQCDTFCHHVHTLYVAFLDYLDARMGPFEELLPFQWMQLREPPMWMEVEVCIKYLVDHGVMVDHSKCFHQFSHLMDFLRDSRTSGDLSTLQTHQKWVHFFSSSHGPADHSELLRMAQVFFSIPTCGADFPRELFLM